MGRWRWKLINDFGFRYKFLCKPCVRCQNSHKLENLQHPYSVFPLVRIEQHLNRYSCYSAYTGMMMTHNSYSTGGSSAILVKTKDISIVLLVCAVVIHVWSMGWFLCSPTHPCLVTDCSSRAGSLVSLAAIQIFEAEQDWNARNLVLATSPCFPRGGCLPVCEDDAVPALCGGCPESHQGVWQFLVQNKQRCEMASSQKPGLCRWRIWDVN